MFVDLQLSPAIEPWPRLRDGVLLAEASGYDTAWAYDHLFGAMLDGPTMLECFTLLGALAATTDRIRVGSLVVNVVNRNPGVLAACAASVQAISGGRFTLGLGAGAAPGSRWSAEHELLGIPIEPELADRHGRLVDVLDELARFWAEDRDEQLATFPRPDPRPPVILGVHSARLAAIAGLRCDGINAPASHPRLPELVRAASEARQRAGRDGPWDVSVWTRWEEALLDPDEPRRVQWAALGVTRLVLMFSRPYEESELARPL